MKWSSQLLRVHVSVAVDLFQDSEHIWVPRTEQAINWILFLAFWDLNVIFWMTVIGLDHHHKRLLLDATNSRCHKALNKMRGLGIVPVLS
jgi:hypothetical protein